MARGKIPGTDRIEEILGQSDLIDKKKIEQAQKIQKEKGGRLSQILVKEGLIDEKTLLSIISQQLDIPLIDLARFTIDTAILKHIPENLVRRYSLIPLARLGKVLTVAMSDPSDLIARDDLRALTGLRIEAVLAAAGDIAIAIDRCYGSEKALDDFFREGGEEEIETKTIREEPLALSDVVEVVKEAPVVKLVDYILLEAVRAKASDILIEPLERSLRVRYRQDGILKEQEPPPKGMQPAIVSRLKVMSQLDIAERRLPQDGRFKARVSGRQVDFRISVVPSTFGEKVAVRILDRTLLRLNVDDLGFEKREIEIIKQCSRRPYGFILICGPTGCGKTTTLYSILKFIDSPEKNLVTVEDPVEYELEGINQVTSRPDIGLSFGTALRAILRQDPNIIMVGEIRDLETVDMAIKSALTGHLVLSSLHTTDAIGSITRLIDMGVEPFLITSSLLMVGAQRLVRKICPNCVEAYSLSADSLNKLGLDTSRFAKTKFSRGKGCKFCQNTGYAGRTSIIEVLAMDEEISNLILQKSPDAEIRRLAQQKGMVSLRENGLKKVETGQSTLEEIIRVTAKDE